MKIRNNMFIFISVLVFLLMHTVVIFWFCQNTPVLALNNFAKILPLLLTLGYIALLAFARKVNFWGLEAFLLTYLGALFLAFCITSVIILITLFLIL